MYNTYIYIYIYIYIHMRRRRRPRAPREKPSFKGWSDSDFNSLLAIFYLRLKSIEGCSWWFCRLGREITISQNRLKG